MLKFLQFAKSCSKIFLEETDQKEFIMMHMIPAPAEALVAVPRGYVLTARQVDGSGDTLQFNDVGFQLTPGDYCLPARMVCEVVARNVTDLEGDASVLARIEFLGVTPVSISARAGAPLTMRFFGTLDFIARYTDFFPMRVAEERRRGRDGTRFISRFMPEEDPNVPAGLYDITISVMERDAA